MGSYLTIVNNTPDTWQCRVGPDTETLMIVTIVLGVIASVLSILAVTGAILANIMVSAGVTAAGAAATSGLAAGAVSTTVVSNLPSALVILGTIPAAVMTWVTSVLAVGAGVTGAVSLTAFGVTTSDKYKEKLSSQGYKTILPGQSHRYGKMTLSLWQKGVCKRTVTGGPFVVINTVTMRPIFSGATANSNRNHDIQYWLKKKNSMKSELIEGTSGKAIEENKDQLLKAIEGNKENIPEGNGKVKSPGRLLEEKFEYRFFPNGTAYNVNTGAIYIA